MKNFIKNQINKLISILVEIFFKLNSGRFLLGALLNTIINREVNIKHNNVTLTFTVPNSINDFRIKTFSTKEPETLEWIDSIPFGSVVWDIGANIGLYTCYAAKSRECHVYAFEPSVFNLELLARNISLNNLSDKVTIIPLPLSQSIQVSNLNMTTTEWGGAMSTFGKDFGQDGELLKKVFEFQTIGLSMVDALNMFKIPQPDYIKMDVDGIEHLILKGGDEVLKAIDGLLIEINEDFHKQSEDSKKFLQNAGLILSEKRHSEMFDNTIYKNSYNQIWHRP